MYLGCTLIVRSRLSRPCSPGEAPSPSPAIIVLHGESGAQGIPSPDGHATNKVDHSPLSLLVSTWVKYHNENVFLKDWISNLSVDFWSRENVHYEREINAVLRTFPRSLSVKNNWWMWVRGGGKEEVLTVGFFIFYFSLPPWCSLQSKQQSLRVERGWLWPLYNRTVAKWLTRERSNMQISINHSPLCLCVWFYC